MHSQPKTSAADNLGLALAMSRMRPGMLIGRHDADADLPPLEQIDVPGCLGRAAAGAWHVFQTQLDLPEAPAAADLAAAVGRTVVVSGIDGRFRREFVSKIDLPAELGGQGVAYLRLGHADSSRGMPGYRVIHRIWDALEGPAQSFVVLTPAEVRELQVLAEAEPAAGRLAVLWEGWLRGALKVHPDRFAQLLVAAETTGHDARGRGQIEGGQ